MRTAIALDEGFIQRVYRTSVVVYALISVYVFAYTGLPGWLGLTAGTGLSLLSLAIVDYGVRRFLKRATTRHGARRTGAPPAGWSGAISERLSPNAYLWWAAIVRYAVYAPAVAAVVWAAQAGALNLFAFLGGFVLVHAVITLKAIGAALVGGRQ